MNGGSKNCTWRILTKATVFKVQTGEEQGSCERLTSGVNGTVTTLLINTRRSSTKWRSGKYHLTGRAGQTIPHWPRGSTVKLKR